MKWRFEAAMSRRRLRLSLPVLPDEVIYDILVKLPVKSLLRFRCVCKSWKTLISHPKFANDHLLYTSTSGSTTTHQRLAVVYDDSTKAVTYSMGSFFENPPTLTQKRTFRMECKHDHFVGLINGLLCLRDDNDCFRLWNPCTKLRSTKSPAFPEEIRLIAHNAFFGYDKVNDKYKVLAFGAFVGYGVITMVARLYTFGESHWRATIHDLPFGPMSSGWGTRQTFVSGNLHWLADRDDGSGKSLIISFDVEKETHGEVLLPPKLDGKIWGLDLHVSNDYLYVTQFSRKTRLVIWVMKEYGVQESWTKLMTISLKLHISRSHICIFNYSHLEPLCILGNSVVVLRSNCSRTFLITYDSKSGKFGRYYRIMRSSREWHGGIYHESLVSPP